MTDNRISNIETKNIGITDNIPIIDLTDVRGFERLYLTLVRDDMIPPGKYTLLYNWYRANALSCGKQECLSRKTFCDILSGTDRKPYKTMIQAVKAIDLVVWNIDIEIAQQDWCVNSYERLNGIWNVYQHMFRDIYGMPPNSQYTSYKVCSDTLNPYNEPLSDLDPQSVRDKSSPRMIYVCAPLRGDNMAENIERAKGYAREILLQGDVPFCPHIYFPQIADAKNPDEDTKAMSACLAYLDNCQQINVYASPPTEGMSMEIERAALRGIPCVDCSPKARSRSHQISKPHLNGSCR